jgi:hypothetical protein
MKPLYKTTVIIWSEVNPDEWELVELACEATSGERAYAPFGKSELIQHPEEDPDWDGTEFFEVDDEDS